ncbi:MAG: DUF4159 domain-containing protein [Qingshengfaniella sp.]
MLVLGPIAFTTPWLLTALLALPVLWFVLRAVPPAPIRRRFPGVALLLGLKDDDSQSDKTPWWLLLLRMLAMAALILGFAGPILNPAPREAGQGPLLVLIDATWADAGDWAGRIDRIDALLAEAARDGRPVAVVAATALEAPVFRAAESWRPHLASLTPAAWEPDPADLDAWAGALEGRFETLWVSDGLAREGRDTVLAALERHGTVRVFESVRPVYGLAPAVYEDGVIRLSVLRARAGAPAEVTLIARGVDPTGVERDLARGTGAFATDETTATVALSLPPELRNRISRFQVAGQRSAGAVSLTDDALRRREVALIAGREDREGLELLSPLHFLAQALQPGADLIEGALSDILPANPDVIVLADVARLAPAEAAGVQAWVEQGGLLLRFAGPRLAASDVSRREEDPLLPVRLREGGRSVGGAMSWGEPKTLMPFAETSPFFGLTVPLDLQITAQVLAQPDSDLAGRVLAALADGTPLVTRKGLGEGQVVLFHVTANAEWSTLPLSGLFVQMLDRLAVSSRPAGPQAAALEGSTWQADRILDGFGQIQEAGVLPGVPGDRLATGRTGPDMPPGIYGAGNLRHAVNVIAADRALAPTVWPERIVVEGLAVARETRLMGLALTLALGLLLADLLASLRLSGRIGTGGRAIAPLVLLVLAAGLVPAPSAQAQDRDDAFALAATGEVVLGHVKTGDPRVDEIAARGLTGLSQVLFSRTSVEPAEPIMVDLERDELAFFPMLYWPITADQPLPSPDAYARLTRYLRSGGMILFDTRDAGITGGGQGPNGRRLRDLAAPLDIPPLEQIPEDHVLTRAFYLLQDFPGRHISRDVWVETAPPGAEQVEGMPFRNLNDGVTPVVIGGNDWAAAWAVDERGSWMFPVGRGYAGDRQRELAYRFGVNLVMYVLTGNYKSDQVHVPALLDRLGQ